MLIGCRKWQRLLLLDTFSFIWKLTRYLVRKVKWYYKFIVFFVEGFPDLRRNSLLVYLKLECLSIYRFFFSVRIGTELQRQGRSVTLGLVLFICKVILLYKKWCEVKNMVIRRTRKLAYLDWIRVKWERSEELKLFNKLVHINFIIIIIKNSPGSNLMITKVVFVCVCMHVHAFLDVCSIL